jgi:hypothetical protein
MIVMVLAYGNGKLSRSNGWYVHPVRIHQHDLEAVVFKPGSEAEGEWPVGSMPMMASINW